MLCRMIADCEMTEVERSISLVERQPSEMRTSRGDFLHDVNFHSELTRATLSVRMEEKRQKTALTELDGRALPRSLGVWRTTEHPGKVRCVGTEPKAVLAIASRA